MSRELTEEQAQLQAEALRAYLAKPRNLGPAFWFKGKGIGEDDRRAILAALRAGGRP